MALENSIIRSVQQVAIVVHDIDAALREYTDRLGIGPWWVKVYAPPELRTLRLYFPLCLQIVNARHQKIAAVKSRR